MRSAAALQRMSAVRQAMPNSSMPSATLLIQNIKICTSGGPNSSIPMSSTGRRSRPPSTHCPESGSHDGTSCDQNRRQAPIKRAAELRLPLADPPLKSSRSSVDFALAACRAIRARSNRVTPQVTTSENSGCRACWSRSRAASHSNAVHTVLRL